MDRRAFIKGAVLTTAMLASGRVQAKTGSEPGALLKLENPENPSKLEQKHVPAIEAPSQVKKGEWFDVRVKVGFMMEHPSTPDHWINAVRLLANKIEVDAQNHLVGGTSTPDGSFRIRLDSTTRLEAVASCNLHGTWIGAPVIVTVQA
jgi:superoxide reductase